MKKEDVKQEFERILREDPDMSAGVAAIKVLSRYIETEDEIQTVQELTQDLNHIIKVLSTCDNVSTISVNSGCELFLRFITYTSLDTPDFAACKKKLLERGEKFVQSASQARDKIAVLACDLLTTKPDVTVLTHSSSRVVLQLFTKLAEQGNTFFTVFITESQPNCSGYEMRDKLRALGINAEVILDAAVGYVMKKIDLVVVGAEGVAFNGGIINKIGTFPICMMAERFFKPVYCLVESFKFVRISPVDQCDPVLPHAELYRINGGTGGAPTSVPEVHVATQSSKFERDLHPLYDFTPPQYIRLLFTDLGILTPSAVSDELLKLYT